jgi:hypothetical protein
VTGRLAIDVKSVASLLRLTDKACIFFYIILAEFLMSASGQKKSGPLAVLINEEVLRGMNLEEPIKFIGVNRNPLSGL